MDETVLDQYRKFYPGYVLRDKDRDEIKEFVQSNGKLSDSFNKSDFIKYVSINRNSLSNILNTKDRGSLNNPVILLISYSLHKWCNVTIDNWPFSYERLKDTLRVLGYSTDLLYDA